MPEKKVITGDEPAHGFIKIASYNTTEFHGLTIKQFFAAAALTGYNGNAAETACHSRFEPELQRKKIAACIEDANQLINALNEGITVQVNQTKLDYLNDQADRLNGGRDYLMQVEPSELTIENVFEAFGFNSSGFDQQR